MEAIEEIKKELAKRKALLLTLQEEMNEIKLLQNKSPAPSVDSLTNVEIAQYARVFKMPEIVVNRQLALRSSSVLVVGTGGVGCPVLLYLASAGIGNIGIVDYQEYELNNPQIGRAKAASAKQILLKLNSKCNIFVHNLPLVVDVAALKLIEMFDVILDCSNNVATRSLLNDACVITGKPLVSGSVSKIGGGHLTVYNYKQGPCYRCIFPIPPPPQIDANYGDPRVLGAVTSIIGTMQAKEAIKIILELPGTLQGRLLLVDGSKQTIRKIRLWEKLPNCNVCSDKPIIRNFINYEEFSGMRASDNIYS